MKEASEIMISTRTGHGNFAVVDPNTYNLLHSAGLINDFGPSNNMVTGSTPVVGAQSNVPGTGMLMGQIMIYRDDYGQSSGANEGWVLVGWKGSGPFDAGYFFCPYVPVWTTNVVDETTGQPRMFFKTRNGRVVNPLADTNGSVTARSNPFYRIFKVTGIQF